MPPTINIENDPTGLVGINTDDKLYTMTCGSGYSCLGFDVCERWTRAYALTLERKDLLPLPEEHGTVVGYHKYARALDALRESGRVCVEELTPQLVGLEGYRVEVVDRYGDRRRFYVGKSTGFVPCHLELKLRSSSGGCAVYGAPFKSIKIVGHKYLNLR